MENESIRLFATSTGAFIALSTFIFKVWTDWKDRKDKFEAELREKRTEQYVKFLTSLSNLIKDANNPKAKNEFLQLCYETILVSDQNLSLSLEELLQAVINFSENSNTYARLEFIEIFKLNNIENNLINQIISQMKNDVLNTKYSSSSIDWLEVIEYLTTEITQENDKNDNINITTTNYFWINANTRYVGDNAWKQMIEKNIACTYGPKRYGNLLKQMKKGDVIFLYVSGKGIINYGELTTPFSGQKNNPPFTDNNHLDEYSIGVKWKNDKIDALKAVSAKSIRAMGHGLFVPTVVGLSASIANKIIKSLQ